MIGRVFGRWTVIGGPAENEKGQKKWLCRCTCGTERYVLERGLLYGGSFSCGCLRRERVKTALSHDLTGCVFGELTVLHALPEQRKTGGVRWNCQCSCGKSCCVSATLLVTGRKTHCGCRAEKSARHADIANQRFHSLTALYPLEKRSAKGYVIWHCRCDCGNEVDLSYHELAFSNRQSCGCQKMAHNEEMSELLTRVDGTCVEKLRSKKIPKNSSTGVKGVYLIKGKYVAKIVFQKKQYYLGVYQSIEAAAEARKEAEEILAEGTVKHYEQWKQRAEADPDWGEENPIRIQVEPGSMSGRLSVLFLPRME